MRLKIAAIFILSILIPTILLAYFGLLAVRSEKTIIEKNLIQRYEAIADIVTDEIKTVLNETPEEQKKDKQYLEKILREQASIFEGQVAIFDKKGRLITNAPAADINKPVFSRPIKNIPYTIAVYERYPQLFFDRIQERRDKLYFYIAIIIFSALSILCGSFLTLRALAKEWQQAQQKSDFVSDLSHELRRPLSSIRMFSEMLKDNRVPNEAKRYEYYNIITTESERLTMLANNILDFSRIERGRVRYNFQRYNIAKLVEETVERFKTYLIAKQRPVSLHIKGKIPEVKIDANAISQALINLMTNADKYSPAGREITINLFANKKQIIIEVVDQGIGIPKQLHNKIFNKFYRSPRKTIAETEGSGLGLSLVKYTIDAHKGRIKVESEEGKGSKFSIILPII